MLSTIMIAVACHDTAAGEPLTAYSHICKDKADAAKWMEQDFNIEAKFHDWKKVQVTEAHIEEGFEIRSPSDDPDHDYVWKVIFQLVN